MYKNDNPAPAPRGPVHRTPFSEIRNHPPAPLPPDHGGENPATIIFTSGTTGDPKAISYTHGQLTLAARAIIRRAPEMPDQARSICWLPLASPFQRIINYCSIAGNWQTFIVPDPVTIMDRIQEIHPHFFASVPRFYEKVYENIRQKIDESPWWMRRAAAWALEIGRRRRVAEGKGAAAPLGLGVKHEIARRLLLDKLRRLMGRDIRFVLSGSAPMNRELLDKFHAMEWLILESYGVSENIVPIGMNTPDHYRFGSVGIPLEENHVKISPGGTVLMKGPGVS
ncbi:MAG: AMP-binding protein, partial [Desulfobacterales bacterium]|nr:AMP-binding protein [Desulfobacterales bacterium]